MVDCILWHKLFQCFHLKIGIRENGEKLKMRNRKRIMENYRIDFCSCQNEGLTPLDGLLQNSRLHFEQPVK